jgi:NAD(P)-dependent dehydrogenase (short-subunit alcohol dehydrogenase family)
LSLGDNLFSVRDQVVLVPGGSRGIGRALAEGFAARGARVVIAGRQIATLARTAREISIGTCPVAAIQCDVGNAGDIARLTEETLAQCGRIDTLLNVAGLNKRMKV